MVKPSPDTQAWQRQKALWAGRGISARSAYMRTIVIRHPQFAHSVKEIRKRVARVIRQRKGAAMSVIAPTGSGKSTLVRCLQEMWPDRHRSEALLRRVVAFTVPPKPTARTMSTALIQAIGDPFWAKGTTQALQLRAKHLLKACRTRLILIDNVHDIPERRSSNGVREIGNWLRDLVDQSEALIVSLGAKQGMDVFDSNSQVRRRSPARVEMSYFEIEADNGVQLWLRFLHELDKKLPLAELSELHRGELPSRLWMATRGIPDYTIQLLTHAVENVVRDNRERITLEDLEHAFGELFLDAAPADNPFSAGAVQLRCLDREGELFHRWLDDGYA